MTIATDPHLLDTRRAFDSGVWSKKTPVERAEILLELADMRTTLGDPHGAERAVVDAVAHAPQNARASQFPEVSGSPLAL